MQEFRTIVKPNKSDFNISHDDRIVSIGSCFSENIGKNFRRYKFRTLINPFGQQYNPFSIANAINRLLQPVEYKKADLVFRDELYHSYDHHGFFSGSTVEETLNTINGDLHEASLAIKNASVLFLTFGTSHVFRLKENNRIVSNCHKMPGNLFHRFMLTVDDIVECTERALNNLWKQNSSVRVILTVSPVRYFAFGHYENSVSKAHLFTAIDILLNKYQQLYYFPAYELVMDDLRDYRFFADDMLHPTQKAIEYVWEVLCETLMKHPTIELMKEIDEILAAAKHSPRNPNSEAHQKFMNKYLEKAKELESKYHINMKEERKTLSNELHKY